MEGREGREEDLVKGRERREERRREGRVSGGENPLRSR